MSMPSISAQTAAAKYAEFNELFSTASEKTIVPQTDVRLLLNLRQIIMRTPIPSTDFQTKAPLFPEKIKTKQILLEDVNTKIEAIRKKWLNFCGAWNISHNCWMIAALQVMRLIPHLRQALITVGEFYSQGNSFDSIHMQAIANKIALYMQNPEQNQPFLDQAKDHYKKITHSIFRLRTFHLLNESQVPPAVLAHFRLPAEYEARVRSYAKITLATMKNPTRDQAARILVAARKHLLDHPEDGYIAKENLLKKCGNDLLTGIAAFDQVGVQNQWVSGEVIQNVRLALYYLSQSRLANGTLISSFSPRASVSEDSYEGIQKIMTEYETILKHQDTPLPASYFSIETIRTWTPDPAFPLEPHDPTRSHLRLGRYSSEILKDHQILVTVPKQTEPQPDKRPMHLEELLKRHSRHSGTESQKYQREDGQVQRYNCVEIRQVIHGAPLQLSFVLNRFIHDQDGSSKNFINVRVPRLMTLPAEMTTLSKPIAYKLNAFVEHSGSIARGHYIAYVNVEGQWIKCDDETITLLTDFEVDLLLNKTVGQKTPYYFYYSKFAEDEQQDMLLAASEMRKQAAAIEKEENNSTGYDHPKLLDLFSEISKLLKDPMTNALKLKEAIQIAKAKYPDHMKMVYLLLDVDSGAESALTAVDDTPEQLGKVLKGWISTAPKQNAIEQLITYVNKEKSVSDLERTRQRFEHILTLLYSEGSDEEFTDQFEKLPLDVQKRFQDILRVEKDEELTFEGAMKDRTLRKYIRDKLTKDVTVDLSSIGRDLLKQTENKQRQIQAQHLMLLFLRIKGGATAKQILKMFEIFDFPKEIKDMLYLEVCKAKKVPENPLHGKRLFDQDPLILAKTIGSDELAENATETITGRLILALAPK